MPFEAYISYYIYYEATTSPLSFHVSSTCYLRDPHASLLTRDQIPTLQFSFDESKPLIAFSRQKTNGVKLVG